MGRAGTSPARAPPMTDLTAKEIRKARIKEPHRLDSPLASVRFRVVSDSGSSGEPCSYRDAQNVRRLMLQAPHVWPSFRVMADL